MHWTKCIEFNCWCSDHKWLQATETIRGYQIIEETIPWVGHIFITLNHEIITFSSFIPCLHLWQTFPFRRTLQSSLRGCKFASTYKHQLSSHPTGSSADVAEKLRDPPGRKSVGPCRFSSRGAVSLCYGSSSSCATTASSTACTRCSPTSSPPRRCSEVRQALHVACGQQQCEQPGCCTQICSTQKRVQAAQSGSF